MVLASIFLTGMVGLVFGVPVRAAPSPERECWAVIVGVSNYQYISDLSYADDDAEDLYDQLVPIFGADHIQLLVDSDATKADIRSAIYDWLAPAEDENDLVVFFFSGHGYIDYIYPYNSLTYSYANDITAVNLNSWLGALDSEEIVVILDSCHSGSFINNLSQSGRVILTASTQSETSWESSALKHGDFSYFLLEAIDQFEDTDTNSDYDVSLEEIFNYARPEVISFQDDYDEGQTPQIGDYYSGELTLFSFIKVIFNVFPSSAPDVIVDGSRYSSLPEELTWITGTEHSFRLESTQVQISDGERLVFSSWSDGSASPSRTETATEFVTYTANFGREYFLTVNSDYGSVSGQGWYDGGRTALFSVGLQIADHGGGRRHVFTGWGGDSTATAAEASITMDSPATVIAAWKPQYYLTVESEYGDSEGEDWYDEGVEAAFSVGPEIVDHGDGSRHVFLGWSGDSTATTAEAFTTVDSPATVTADWQPQYYLTVESEYGDPEGEGWYDEGSIVTVSVPPSEGIIVRQVFTGWSGDLTDDTPSAQVSMYAPKRVTAEWRTDYVQLFMLIGGVVVLAGAIWFAVAARRRG